MNFVFYGLWRKSFPLEITFKSVCLTVPPLSAYLKWTIGSSLVISFLRVFVLLPYFFYYHVFIVLLVFGRQCCRYIKRAIYLPSTLRSTGDVEANGIWIRRSSTHSVYFNKYLTLNLVNYWKLRRKVCNIFTASAIRQYNEVKTNWNYSKIEYICGYFVRNF